MEESEVILYKKPHRFMKPMGSKMLNTKNYILLNNNFLSG
jgi:hypothetical protein